MMYSLALHDVLHLERRLQEARDYTAAVRSGADMAGWANGRKENGRLSTFTCEELDVLLALAEGFLTASAPR